MFVKGTEEKIFDSGIQMICLRRESIKYKRIYWKSKRTAYIPVVSPAKEDVI